MDSGFLNPKRLQTKREGVVTQGGDDLAKLTVLSEQQRADNQAITIPEVFMGEPAGFTAKYAPYGHVGVRCTAGFIGLNGQWFQPWLGAYALGNGYRIYNPSLMRFLSPDVSSPFMVGGGNAYAYCNGDPVNKVDPSGHSGRSSGNRLRPQGIAGQITSGNHTVGNIYSPAPAAPAAPQVSVGDLTRGLAMNKETAVMLRNGVPLELLKRVGAQKIPLHSNFIEHKGLPEVFLLAGVDELLSTGQELVVASHANSLYYFTLSDSGINIRSQEQWYAKTFSPPASRLNQGVRRYR